MKGGAAPEPLRVLLVEDSGDDAYFLLRELRRGGYDPEHLRVDTLAATAEALANSSWDLLISDYNLPRFNALDVLRLLRERNIDVPTLVISGAIGEDLAVETMRAGAHDYIMKDNLRRLLPAVARELKETQVRRERQRAQHSLRESEERFRELTETIHEVFWMIDCATNRMIYVSPAYERVWLRSDTPLRTRLSAFLETVHPEDFDRVQAHLERDGWAGFNQEYRIQRPDGSERWVHTRSFPIRAEDGTVQRIAGLTVDINERKRLEGETQKLSRALEQTADAVMILDRDGLIEYVNAAFEDLTGYSRDELFQRQPKVLRSDFQDEAFYAQVWRTLQNGLPFTDVFISRRKDGEFFYEERTITPVRDSSREITHYVSTGRDVTKRLRAEQRVQQKVRQDAATGLASRILFLERLDQSLLNARREGRAVGVLTVGIDCSELLGADAQPMEEKLLPQLAERLRQASGGKDLIARLERGEFALRRSTVGSQELELLARALITSFEEPIRCEGYELFLRPSIGIALFPRDGEQGEELLANACLAMRASREQHRSGYEFFTVRMRRPTGNLLTN
jgi:sigma-B regulation protein RsbU (phosphoserine phosphatase)